MNQWLRISSNESLRYRVAQKKKASQSLQPTAGLLNGVSTAEIGFWVDKNY